MITNRVSSLLFPEDDEKQRLNQKTKMYLRNPLVKRDGSLSNPYMDYQGLLDSNKTSSRVKRLITDATGLKSSNTDNSTNTSTTSGNDTERNAAYQSMGGGTTINVPQGLGKNYTYMNWNTITNMDTEQGRLIKQAGKNYDSNGYGKVGDRYAVAMTSTFGKIGDCVDIYMSDGRVIPAVIADEKSQVVTAWDNNPANQWGHDNGQCIVEWVTNWNGHDNPKSDGSVLKVVNRGSYFDSPGLANSASFSSSSTTSAGTSGSGSFASLTGKRVANTASYNNDAAKGQCVWYVRGRMKEKLGKDVGAIGNANQMYYNAPDRTKVQASAANLGPNMLVSYQKGTSAAGATAGHVIFIEDVQGDTVYYTEGGSGYYKNGTDGVVKTATRQQIMNGVNSSGARIGSGVLGFVDLNKL